MWILRILPLAAAAAEDKIDGNLIWFDFQPSFQNFWF